MPNNFKSVAQDIIDNYINSVIYVDDKIALPFSDNNDNTLSFCKKLYKNFKDNNCLIDFINFTNLENLKEEFLYGKELIILDWLLDQEEPKYKSTLKIIERVIETDSLHFLIIYTKEPEKDFQDIFHQIKSYFSGYTDKVYKKVFNTFKEFLEQEGIDHLSVKTDIKAYLKELALFSNRKGDVLKKIRKVLQSHSVPIDRFNKKFEKIFDESNLVSLYEKLGYCLNDNILSDIKINRKNTTLYFDKNFIKISNTFIYVTNKEVIVPDELYNSFSNIIIKSSNNYLTFMGLEMRNLLKETSAFIGEEIERIDETAFFHHEKNIHPKEAFYDFLKEMWKDRSSSFLYKEGKKPKIFEVLSDYKKKRDIDQRLTDQLDNSESEFLKNLAILNYHYNILNIKRPKDDNIKFGDVFEICDGDQSNKYILCVTAHCDCLYPEEKLNNNLYFVEGHKNNLKKCLEEGDSGFNSFIKKDKNPEIIPIKWKNKPYTIYISSDQNNINKDIEIEIGRKQYKMKYLCTLKDNYVQRITNKAFSYPLRVGIFFADYK